MTQEFKKRRWEMDRFNGIFTDLIAKGCIGFFQDYACTCTAAERKEQEINCRMLENGPELYDFLLALYRSNKQPGDTDRQFETMRQADLLIERMNSPIIMLPRTRPSVKRS